MATAYQKIKFPLNQWPIFERSMVETEIKEQRIWKIEVDGALACVWTITFADPQIWEHSDDDQAIYIHRIATNPVFRGKNLVSDIVIWAKEYCVSKKKHFIRMDTCGYNTRLIAHYQNCGFDFLGISKLSHTDNLPSHYHNAEVCFFEIVL
ncbi:MAG: GNAT family N-acetyltransferase [Flavobacteriales bacterium]|nr:MAG: GNAT family N-acetyltransferase [Flavobacteriales bacterium]